MPSQFGRFMVFLGLIALGIFVGTWFDPSPEADGGTDRRTVWLITFALVLGSITWLGYCVSNGYWRGALIDGRNKISLSRLQQFVWTALVMSALLAATLTNAQFAESASLIEVPEEIWFILGITTTSMVAAPAILTAKAKTKPDPDEYKATAEQLRDEGATEIVEEPHSIILCNKTRKGASWLDLFRGEEAGEWCQPRLGQGSDVLHQPGGDLSLWSGHLGWLRTRRHPHACLRSA